MKETSYPDFTFEDSQKAIQDGQITIYSSNPIEKWTFVSTSKMMAQDYAGGRLLIFDKFSVGLGFHIFLFSLLLISLSILFF